MTRFLVTLLLTSFFCVAPLTGALAKGEPIKLGLMAPLTGSFASEGQDMQKIIELMVEETNKAGGINGAPVELIVEDDGSTPRSAATAASRLVAQEVVAVIGTYGSAVTEASQDIYDEMGVVQVATGSTSIRLTSKGMKGFFRTCPRDDEQGRVMAKAVQDLGFKKIAILHDNSAYGKGLADEMKNNLKGVDGASIPFFDALQPGERDYSAVLTKIKGIQPDVIVFTGYYPEAGLLLRQMDEMGWKVPMIGGDAANNLDLVLIAGVKAAVGYRFVSPPMPDDMDTEDAKNFLAAYHAKHGASPSSIWSVLAGDAYLVLKKAIEEKGADSGAVAEYLTKDLKDFMGLSGHIAFDDKGDRISDVYRLYEVDKTGKFVLQPR